MRGHTILQASDTQMESHTLVPCIPVPTAPYGSRALSAFIVLFLLLAEEINWTGSCRVVGWYHSHPTFATFPSMIDISNQVTQQNAHKTATCEPYIAAIVGPYHKKLPTCQSSISWFYVNHEAGKIPAEDENPLQFGCTPMQLQVCFHCMSTLIWLQSILCDDAVVDVWYRVYVMYRTAAICSGIFADVVFVLWQDASCSMVVFMVVCM